MLIKILIHSTTPSLLEISSFFERLSSVLRIGLTLQFLAIMTFLLSRINFGEFQFYNKQNSLINSKNRANTLSLAETRGFEPPFPFRENLISSEAH
jgi:hypothetical protein